MWLSRRFPKNLDLPLVTFTLLLAVWGVAVIYSATRASGGDPLAFVRSRLVHLAVGLVAMGVMAALDYRGLARAWRVLYVLNLALLVWVLVAGRTSLGAQRWISVGPLGTLQPSEFAKLILIITLAQHLALRREPPATPLQFAPYLLHVGVPMFLIFRQPDLGTSLVCLAILFGMLSAAGARPRHLLALAGIGMALTPVLWHLLKDYQRRRLLIFLDPTVDPLGSGYAVIQSKIAVGSGLLTGKGVFKGTQTLLQFVPERHTDFIFTVVGEEMGFVGSMVLLLLFLLWLWRGLTLAAEARDRVGTLMGVGVVSMIAFHLFVNVGMTVGLMPITGIPLPFLSYGGSALLTALMGTGLL
ncbi:MAG: rod shape-determining protein RodA, partial [Armatimonadetes bacterium]|nr:rod shape-determining protein RodA [Armatimonadota bacterium]